MKAGSLELDFPESKIRLDEEGKVLRIERVENDISHQLIEEYMLLANEAVAGRLMAMNRPAIYRIHEPPDEKRLQEYRQDVLSHQISCGNLSEPSRSAKIVAKAQHAGDRAGVEDWIFEIAHAGAVFGRAAGALRAGEEKIHAFHVAHPALRGPGGASDAFSTGG